MNLMLLVHLMYLSQELGRDGRAPAQTALAVEVATEVRVMILFAPTSSLLMKTHVAYVDLISQEAHFLRLRHW